MMNRAARSHHVVSDEPSSNSSSMAGSTGSGSGSGRNSGNENDSNGDDGDGASTQLSKLSSALCASCDRCRARKSRCDGQRPCSACKHNYMKKHKLTSCDGVDPERFECVYSPAKRRGPVPGHKVKKSENATAAMKAVKEAMLHSHSSSKKSAKKSAQPLVAAAAAQGGNSFPAMGQAAFASMPGSVGVAAAPYCGGPHAAAAAGNYAMGQNNMPLLSPLDPNAAALQQHILSSLGAIGLGLYASYAATGAGAMPGLMGTAGAGDTMASNQDAAKQHLAYIQQLQMQQQMQVRQDQAPPAAATASAAPAANDLEASNNSDSVGATSSAGSLSPTPGAQAVMAKINTEASGPKHAAIGCEKPNAVKFLHLLNPNDPDGVRFRACYALSFGSLFGLPPIPSDEEYCHRFEPTGSFEPHLLPKFDIAALQAARFAEIAMGALANGQRPMVLELANASVLCLQDCAEEPVHPSCMFDVARAYFFHGIFRAYFGDMERYFKYRRVSLRHLAQLDGVPGVEMLMAAISFQDSLAYMIHNATEDELPDISDEIPHVTAPTDAEAINKTSTTEKYGISSAPSLVASNPMNQMWIQGPPPVFINHSAPTKSRVIDAIACAIRSSLDESKAKQTPSQSATQVEDSRKRKYVSDTSSIPSEVEAKDKTATEKAVECNHEELSCRNLLAEASSLLQKHEETSPSANCTFGGHHLLVSALDVMFNIDWDEPGELDDSQIQNLLNVTKTIIERPMLLFQGGPTYHIINNCAIFMAHFLNKLHSEGVGYESAKALFEEVLDAYNGSRMVLNSHRNKLPYQLRCHELPRPNMRADAKNGENVINFSKVLLCTSRNCQDCVMMGSSSEEVAKRAKTTAVAKSESEDTKSSTSSSTNEYDRHRSELEKEFDVDDRALLVVLSRMISPPTKRGQVSI